MITTNILLTLLIGLHLIKFFKKNKKTIFSKYWSYLDKKNEGDQYRDKLVKLHSVYKKELKVVKDDLDRHIVFTAKSLSELKEEIDKKKKCSYPVKDNWKDEIVSSDKKEWKGGSLDHLFNFKSKKIKSKFTNFQLDKEIFRHLQKRGLLKVLSIKSIKDIKFQCGELPTYGVSEYKKERQNAYQRLWQRENYKSKNK